MADRTDEIYQAALQLRKQHFSLLQLLVELVFRVVDKSFSSEELRAAGFDPSQIPAKDEKV